MLPLPLLFALSFSAPPAPQGVNPEVHALVVKCVDAYGGPKAVARMARARHEGTVTSQVLHPGAPGRLARAYQRPGRLRVEIAYPDGAGEVRVLDGSQGWRDGEPAHGGRLVAMILQAARMDLPSLLAAWEARVRDLGAVDLDGKVLRALALEVAPGVVVEAHLDPATGRILRSRGGTTGGGPGLAFVTTYSDFRVVDGVLVPFREGNWANGTSTGETVLATVTFPPAFEDGTFRPAP